MVQKQNPNESHYVYIVECRDGTLYTGYTTDVQRRIEEHNGKRKGGAKYTSPRGPVSLRYTETFETSSDAKKREYEIKRLSRNKKIHLFCK